MKDCPGCYGMLDAFVQGVLDSYDEAPLEEVLLEFIEQRLRVLLIDKFGFCADHANESCRRLAKHAGQKKLPPVNTVQSKGWPS